MNDTDRHNVSSDSLDDDLDETRVGAADDEDLFLDAIERARTVSPEDTGSFDYDTQTFAAIEDAGHSFGNNSGITGEWEAVQVDDFSDVDVYQDDFGAPASDDRYVRSNDAVDSFFHDGDTDRINRAQVAFSVHHGTNARDKAAIIETLPVMDDDEDVVVDAAQSIWPFEFAEGEEGSRRAKFSTDVDDELNALSQEVPEQAEDDAQKTIFKTGEFQYAPADGTLVFKASGAGETDSDDAEDAEADTAETSGDKGAAASQVVSATPAEDDSTYTPEKTVVFGAKNRDATEGTADAGAQSVGAASSAGGGEGHPEDASTDDTDEDDDLMAFQSAIADASTGDDDPMAFRGTIADASARESAAFQAMNGPGLDARIPEDDDSMIFAKVIASQPDDQVPEDEGGVYADDRYAWGDTFSGDEDEDGESWDEVEKSVLEAAATEQNYVRSQGSYETQGTKGVESVGKDGATPQTPGVARSDKANPATQRHTPETPEPSDFVKQMLAGMTDDGFQNFNDERKNVRETMQEVQNHIDHASTREFENIGIEEVVEVERLRNSKRVQEEFDDWAPPSEREPRQPEANPAVPRSGRGTSRAHAKKPSPRKPRPAQSRAAENVAPKKEQGAQDAEERVETRNRTARHEASQRPMTPFGVPLPHIGRSGPTPQKRTPTSRENAVKPAPVDKNAPSREAVPPTPATALSDEQRLEDEKFMRLAIEQAKRASAIEEVPIGAIVVCDGQVVASAYNRREIDYNPSAHAEAIALQEASSKLRRWRLTGCTVYVTLEPCIMCAGLMQQARIDRCVFGAFDSKGGALGSLYNVAEDNRLNHTFEVTSGVCGDECSQMLKDFFSGLRGK